jgi:hypothetical protein
MALRPSRAATWLAMLLSLGLAPGLVASCTYDFDAAFQSGFRAQDASAEDSGADSEASPDAPGLGGAGGAGGSAGNTGKAGQGGAAGAGGTTQQVCGNQLVEPPELCDDGFQTACGLCNADCTGAGTGSVCGDGELCPDTEACDDGFQTACGACNAVCTGAGTGSVCGDGVPCPDTEACDDGDNLPCGTCNDQCDGPGEPIVCGCASGTALSEIFNGGMVGCRGVITWPDRAQLCGEGFQPCTAAQWVALRGGAAPDYQYWTDDELRYEGVQDSCWVLLSGGKICSPASAPMRVCTGASDALGNTCTWFNCGYLAAGPNEFFGGCSGGTTTAGTLCCPM